jgi:hypothetical protein
MLSYEMWNLKPTEYHITLDNDIRVAVAEVLEMKAA